MLFFPGQATTTKIRSVRNLRIQLTCAAQKAHNLTMGMLSPHSRIPSFVAGDEDDGVDGADEVDCFTKNMYIAAPFATTKINRETFYSIY